MFLEIFAVAVLFIPLLAELWNDRNGDVHPNYDLIFRVLFTVVCSIVSACINPHLGFWGDFLRCLCLSTGVFVSFFPYAMNIVHYRNGVTSDPKWWKHLSKEAVPDKWPWWAATPWFARMFFLLLLLFIGMKIYFCPFRLINFYNNCL